MAGGVRTRNSARHFQWHARPSGFTPFFKKNLNPTKKNLNPQPKLTNFSTARSPLQIPRTPGWLFGRAWLFRAYFWRACKACVAKRVRHANRACGCAMRALAVQNVHAAVQSVHVADSSASCCTSNPKKLSPESLNLNVACSCALFFTS